MSDTVHIHLRFFASVREQLGRAELTIELPDAIDTVGQLRDYLITRGEAWAIALASDKPLRMAYQQVMCEASEPLLHDAQHQEVAFFPPVTGG